MMMMMMIWPSHNEKTEERERRGRGNSETRARKYNTTVWNTGSRARQAIDRSIDRLRSMSKEGGRIHSRTIVITSASMVPVILQYSKYNTLGGGWMGKETKIEGASNERVSSSTHNDFHQKTLLFIYLGTRKLLG